MDYIGPHLRIHRQQDREQDWAGIIFSALGASGITGLNLYSMVVAVIGAVVVLVIYHLVSGRRAY
jgi:hypothetical protein